MSKTESYFGGDVPGVLWRMVPGMSWSTVALVCAGGCGAALASRRLLRSKRDGMIHSSGEIRKDRKWLWQAEPTGFEAVMSTREAAAILGVRERDRREHIQEAHRRLIAVNHPDLGGSDYLASKVNEAKMILSEGISLQASSAPST